jgi:hypothetical protein
VTDLHDDIRSLERLARYLVRDPETAERVVAEVLDAGPPDVAAARTMVTGRCQAILRGGA